MPKTPDEIKKGLECCKRAFVYNCGDKCDTCDLFIPAYIKVERCADALAYIQQLETDNQQLEGLLHHMNQLRDAAAGRALKMEERVQQLEDLLSGARKAANRLEAERDALMDYLQSMGCDTCLHDNYDAPDSPCNVCTATRDMWVFEGVQKEE